MPRLEPHLTVRAIRPLVSGLRRLAHDPAPILAEIGIDDTALNDPDARVPVSVATSLLARAVAATGDDHLGLHLAEHTELGSTDVHFHAMASSPTLGAAFERLCRYQRLIHETSRVELEIDGERAALRHELAGGKAAPRHSAEFLLAAWVRAGRVVTGVDWAPLAVHFAHEAPPEVTEYARFFRTAVHFGMGENALHLPAALLQTPCLQADASLLDVLDRYAADRLERAPRTSALADRVRTLLRDQLQGGEPSAEGLAARLRMSVRTLNRLLAAEGTSYRELLDTLRRELAMRHLTGNQVSIAEVAFLLGFSEISSFHRAFRRWTGRTPAEFRREHHRQRREEGPGRA